MRLNLREIHGSLHQSLQKSLCRTTSRSRWLRQYSASGQNKKDIGIIGGGITGLTAAFKILLLHKLSYSSTPTPKITIYESGPRLGGWVQSPTVKTPGGQNVVFEQGPRTLRTGSAASLVTLEMVSIHDISVMLIYEKEIS
jgi:oxygen-dependent protoporphyrinogen oxidase